MLDIAQIVQSAQVWVCDSCGNHDPKACGCNSTAHAEAMAAKKEAKRQADRARNQDRRKAERNQGSVSDIEIRDIENTEECATADADDIEDEVEPDNRRSAFFIRADQAIKFAAYSGPVDKEIIEAASATALAWEGLARHLRRMTNGGNKA